MLDSLKTRGTKVISYTEFKPSFCWARVGDEQKTHKFCNKFPKFGTAFVLSETMVKALVSFGGACALPLCLGRDWDLDKFGRWLSPAPPLAPHKPTLEAGAVSLHLPSTWGPLGQATHPEAQEGACGCQADVLPCSALGWELDTECCWTGQGSKGPSFSGLLCICELFRA